MWFNPKFPSFRLFSISSYVFWWYLKRAFLNFLFLRPCFTPCRFHFINIKNTKIEESHLIKEHEVSTEFVHFLGLLWRRIWLLNLRQINFVTKGNKYCHTRGGNQTWMFRLTTSNSKFYSVVLKFWTSFSLGQVCNYLHNISAALICWLKVWSYHWNILLIFLKISKKIILKWYLHFILLNTCLTK